MKPCLALALIATTPSCFTQSPPLSKTSAVYAAEKRPDLGTQRRTHTHVTKLGIVLDRSESSKATQQSDIDLNALAEIVASAAEATEVEVATFFIRKAGSTRGPLLFLPGPDSIPVKGPFTCFVSK
jgi:hypothetical protein